MLTYCSQIWGQPKNQHVSRIIRLQNRALRIINFADYRSPKEILYRQTNILKFADNIQVSNFLFVHDCLNGNIPSCLENTFAKQNNIHSYMTKASIQNQVTLPRSRTEQYGIQSITFQSATTWNKYMQEFSNKNMINKSKSFCKRILTKNLFENY